MFIIGLRDDILALTAKQKLYSQLLPVFVLVLLNKTTLHSSYGLGGYFEFPEAVAILLTAFVLLILTNAYNLIDGLDGLAGTVGCIILVAFGLWFYLTGDNSVSLIAFTFAGSILAFLCFNWQPSRIFMGDTGALMIGLLISYLAIRFIDSNYSLPEGHAYKFNSSIGTAICVLIIPVFDTLRVIILRLRKMQSPFKADKNHIHHQFLNLGFSHAHAVTWIGFISVFFVSIAVLLRKQGDWVLIGMSLIVCLIINYWLKTAQSKRALQHGAKN